MSTKLEERQNYGRTKSSPPRAAAFAPVDFTLPACRRSPAKPLSVGQIYRYFSNKDAIIEEMIRRIIDSRIEEMQGKTPVEGMPQALAGARRLTKMMTR